MRLHTFPNLDGPTESLIFTSTITHHRATALLSILAGIVAALLEGATLVLFTVALEMLLGSSAVSAALGPFSGLLDTATRQTTPGTLFIGLILVAVALQVPRACASYAGLASAGHLRITIQGEMRRRVFGHKAAEWRRPFLTRCLVACSLFSPH